MSGKKNMTQITEVPNLLTCIFKHEINETKTTLEWKGPKISPEVWNRILAFFKWTQDTTRSESQVRLYVNTRTGVWDAWAFPQKAKTGMSAQEIANEAAAEQRAQFGPQDGWIYFGTVHHHCTMGAFQSSTDLNNEKDQDGIHITVGHLDKPQYDLHSRFYLKGNLIDGFKLSDFWNVVTNPESILATIPAPIRPSLPVNAKEIIAKYEMGIPAPADTVFPEVWKTNLIYEVPVVVSTPVNHSAYPQQTRWNKFYVERSITARQPELDYGRAIDRLNEYMDENPMVGMKEMMEAVAEMAESMSDLHLDILDILAKNDTTPEQFLQMVIEKESKKQQHQDQKKQQQTLIGEGGPHHHKDLEQEYWEAMGMRID